MNQALETYLVRFAKDFCALNLEDEFTTGHYLYDFGMANFKQTTDPPHPPASVFCISADFLSFYNNSLIKNKHYASVLKRSAQF